MNRPAEKGETKSFISYRRAFHFSFLFIVDQNGTIVTVFEIQIY